MNLKDSRAGYEALLQQMMHIRLDSIDNYKNREELFKTQFLRFLSESAPI